MNRLVTLACLVGLAGPALAQEDPPVWHDTSPGEMMAFGPPETDAIFSLRCKPDGSLEGWAGAPTDADPNAPLSVLIQGLGGSEVAIGKPEEDSDAMMSFPIKPGSILITSLLLDQDIRISSGGMRSGVDGAKAGPLLSRILRTCLKGVNGTSPIRPGVSVTLPQTGQAFQGAMQSPPPARVAALPTRNPPRYGQFPVRGIFTGPYRPVILDTPDKQSYRTRLRNAANGPVNFGGRYNIAIWGCGTSCVTGGIVDLVTGAASFFPGSVVNSNRDIDDFDGVMFRRDSRLLVLSGQINEDGPNGMHFYEMRDTGLVRIDMIELPKDMTGWTSLRAKL